MNLVNVCMKICWNFLAVCESKDTVNVNFRDIEIVRKCGLLFISLNKSIKLTDSRNMLFKPCLLLNSKGHTN